LEAMTGALRTDLYELNMAASYLRRGMHEPATFSLYMRSLPPQRGFLVAAGLEPCLEFLERLRFQPDELEYLGSIGFDDAALERFQDLRFDGDVWAVPEGRVVFANEPLIEVTAPVAVAQLVETFLLNQVTMHTTLASKAARYRIAAGGRDLVDFAFRRTHGMEAATAVARTSAMAGFVSTSNVEAARALRLRVAGTMAHSYIETFPSEAEAFRAFAEDFPGRTTFLVDTYDTLNGVRTAIDVIRDMGLEGNLGIRLDSGNLGPLSRDARTILDVAGLPSVRIFASGGLDELEVESLVQGGAPIDAYGIGTQLGVSFDAPGLESVYKLVRYGRRPVLKLSAGKATLAGEKQVFRAEDGDVLGLRAEPVPDDSEPLLQLVMESGRRSRPEPSIGDARARFEADLQRLPEPARRLVDPEPQIARVSDQLAKLTEETREHALARLRPHDSAGSH
jgi:nicotinate phosphoribosyltransferase